MRVKAFWDKNTPGLGGYVMWPERPDSNYRFAADFFVWKLHVEFLVPRHA